MILELGGTDIEKLYQLLSKLQSLVYPFYYILEDEIEPKDDSRSHEFLPLPIASKREEAHNKFFPNDKKK